MKKKRIEMYFQLPRGVGWEELTDEEAGQIIKYLDQYTGESRHIFDSPLMRLVYKRCCDHIDTESERYDAFCEKKRENIRKRYEKAQQSTSVDTCIQANTSEYNSIQANTSEYNSIQMYTHNHNQNTESKSESKTETESETESESKSTSYGGGGNNNTAAATVERLMSDIQFMNDTSQLVMMPLKLMRDEMQKFALQLRVTNDTTTDEHEIIKGLLAWLRKGKRMNETDKAKSNASSTRHNAGDDIQAYIARRKSAPEAEMGYDTGV